MSDGYPYLAKLTKTEFNAVTTILRKYGVKGLLSTVWELADFNLKNPNNCPADTDRAERVVRELGALIERLQGFEELINGGAR